MSIYSFEFCFFFIIVFGLYWMCPAKWRSTVLLLFSVVFYALSGILWLVIVTGLILCSYICVFAIERLRGGMKTCALSVGVIIPITILLLYKYYGAVASVIMPLGMSFYIFKIISVQVDLYRGNIDRPSFVNYALYILLFLEITAGPIDRFEVLGKQFLQEKVFDYNKSTYGLKMAMWGCFQKTFADILSEYVDTVYLSLYKFKGFPILAVVIMYSMQIYLDFSGYSNMVIGLARTLGIDLVDNFRSPYLSLSIREFWNRWHISLSKYLRDYIYIPLGGNRKGKIRKYLNFLITFIVSGVWHGIGWNYVVWGGIHALGIIVEDNVKVSIRKTIISNLIRTLLTFTVITIAWVFFRAGTIEAAMYIFINMFDGVANPIEYVSHGVAALELNRFSIIRIIIFSILVAFYDYYSVKGDVITGISKLKAPIRWLVYLTLMFATAISIPTAASTDFLYYKF